MTQPGEPRVDVVIAVHDPARPLGRAIGSLLQSGLELESELRITVVCHNVDTELVLSTLDDAARRAIRVMELHDGIASAAGPFTAGIDAASSDFVSIMGSDDRLEPLALRSWLTIADRGGYAAVIAPQRHARGALVRTPPVRPFRRGRRDGVRDRLAYRTAPLGLISTRAVRELDLRLAAGFSTGEDHSFSVPLWFSGLPVAYAKGCPRYVVGDDAADRVTLTQRSIANEFESLWALLDGAWFTNAQPRERRALVIKLVRVHVFGAVHARGVDRWATRDREAVAEFLPRLAEVAPGFEEVFSIADRRLLDALLEVHTPIEVVARLSIARRNFGHPATVVTRNLRGQFAIEGPIRFMVASALL